jgi:integrase
VAESTQTQALLAIRYTYKKVLGSGLAYVNGFNRAYKPRKIPVVFSPQEVKAVIGNLSGHHRLIALLMYGAGLRLMEAMRLRVKHVDFHYQQLTILYGKGRKDRVTVLPQSIFDELKAQIDQVAVQHRHDVEQGAS